MITKDQLSRLYPSAGAGLLNAFATQADGVFQQFGLSVNTNRLYYFLAQIGHESAGLTSTEEGLNYSAQRLTQVWPTRFPNLTAAQPYANNPEKLANFVYANRMGNGPPESGDGYRYRGRGFIQITGKEAYQALGAAAGIDLIAQPELAEAVSSALPVACGYWKWKNLNPVCDSGDFKRVTQIINGGLAGLEDRQNWLDKVQRILGGAPAPFNPSDPAIIKAVQQALLAKGYSQVGSADGVQGARTRDAITAFRQDTGLPAGDAIDPTLLSALGISQ